MFTRKDLKIPVPPSGDADFQREWAEFRRANYEQWRELQRFFRALNNKGALSLSQLSLDMSDEAGNSLVLPTGTWTPEVTFDTPGDLNVAYTTQIGNYTRIGNSIRATFNITTSTFTHSTASGNLRVAGLPEAASGTATVTGALLWGGITKASYTQIVARVASGDDYVRFTGSGSGVAASNIAVADTTSGGTLRLEATVFYRV